MFHSYRGAVKMGVDGGGCVDECAMEQTITCTCVFGPGSTSSMGQDSSKGLGNGWRKNTCYLLIWPELMLGPTRGLATRWPRSDPLSHGSQAPAVLLRVWWSWAWLSPAPSLPKLDWSAGRGACAELWSRSSSGRLEAVQTRAVAAAAAGGRGTERTSVASSSSIVCLDSLRSRGDPNFEHDGHGGGRFAPLRPSACSMQPGIAPVCPNWLVGEWGDVDSNCRFELGRRLNFVRGIGVVCVLWVSVCAASRSVSAFLAWFPVAWASSKHLAILYHLVH